MQYSVLNRSVWTVSSFLRVLFLVAIAFPVPWVYANNGVPPPSLPFKYQKHHIHYDINSDGSYTVQGEDELVVLNQMGIQMVQLMPFTTKENMLPLPGPDIESITAFSVKKNGKRIPAASVSAPPGLLPPGMSASPSKMRFFAFQQVEVGDVLAVTYRSVQKTPILKNNIVLEEVFQGGLQYADTKISLTAPVSMRLRVEESGVEKGQSHIEGAVQKWEWKYQGKTSDAPISSQKAPINLIHISSFMDIHSEMEAINKQTQATSAAPIGHDQCQAPPGAPNDGPRAMEAYSTGVAEMFWRADDYLIREINSWKDPACVFDDGRPRLGALISGLSQAFRSAGDWNKSLERIEYLKKKYPKEAVVALAEVQFWRDYAWDARGSGYASSVPEEGWKLMRERMEKAEKVLVETKSYSADLPGWYEAMIGVQSTLSRPEDERDKVFMEGVRRYPSYYGMYFEMLNFLEPKWGGSWRTVDNMIRWSIEQTKATEGYTNYARIYWVVSQTPQVNLFKDTFATWPLMKRGFEDLMARHPKSKWNLNNFAKFACMAGDKQMFLKLRKQIGKDVIDDAWPQNTSLDLCETKFGYTE